MNDVDPPQVDPVWRAEMLAAVASDDLGRATDALLSLTNHETDRSWLESTLLEVIDGHFDLQVRQLAVVCLGHVARIHREAGSRVVSKLQELRTDPNLGARARNALEDIVIFAQNAS